MSNPEQVVSKSEFARIAGVSPGRITQWIDEGKISGAGLVGEGRSARIRVEVALQQVNLRRDIGQALGNGLHTRLTSPKAAPQASEGGDEGDGRDPYGGWSPDGTSDDVDRKLKLAKLEAAERSNRLDAIEEAASEGRYTESVVMRAEMGKIAGQMLRIFEGMLPAIATALAGQFELEARDVTHALNEQFRKVREQAASAAAKHAQTLAEQSRTAT